ncbi:MAG: hypothetical protein QXS05_07025, partial [Candidatus Bathyarchaeia archaeon]
SRKVNYIELGAERDFQAEFFNSHLIPYADLSRYPETMEELKKLGRDIEKPPIIFNRWTKTSKV